jgi:hypothetical protein
MPEYYEEEQPPSCKITIVVFIIVYFFVHDIMAIGIFSSMNMTNPYFGILLTVVLASALFIQVMDWILKRNERWMDHKFGKEEPDEEELKYVHDTISHEDEW